MSARILIAGAGDVGQRVAALLHVQGHAVWTLRRSAVQASPGIHAIQGDLTKAATLTALPAEISHVVYLPTPGARDEASYRAVFVDGLHHLLGALDAKRLQRLVFVSSSAVYGDHGDDWVDEHTPPAPMGFNGRVLLDAERIAASLSPSVALRLAGLYGPGRLELIERLRRGDVRVPRQPVHWANRIHVDDAAGAIAHLLFAPDIGPVYLGVDDTPLPLHVLYEHLARLAEAPVPGDGPAPAGVGSKRLSNAGLRARGFVPRWPDARDGYAALLARND